MNTQSPDNNPDNQTFEYKTETIKEVEFVKFSADKQDDKSFLAPVVGLIIFILPVAIAFRLCDWRVVLSFLNSIITVPAIFIGFGFLYSLYTENESWKWSEFGVMVSMFALIGIPIYFLLVLPLYYLLLGFSFPIWISFPLVITLIMGSIFFLLTTKPLGFTAVGLIAVCSIFHAAVILSGIFLLKKWFP